MVDVLDRLLWIYNHRMLFNALNIDFNSHSHFSSALEDFFSVVWAVKDKNECIMLTVESNSRRWKDMRDTPIHFPPVDLSPLYRDSLSTNKKVKGAP